MIGPSLMKIRKIQKQREVKRKRYVTRKSMPMHTVRNRKEEEEEETVD